MKIRKQNVAKRIIAVHKQGIQRDILKLSYVDKLPFI